MNISPLVRRIVFLSLAVVFVCLNIAAQGKATRGDDPFQHEVWGRENPEFVKRHSLGPDGDSAVMIPKRVRFIYLVPSDRSPRDDYKAAMTDAALHLQDFYQKELGSNYAFTLNDPIVEVYQTSHTVNYYQTHDPGSGNPAGYYWENSLADGFALTGGGFNDPNNRWIFYNDAEPTCIQYAGGTSGVALLHSGDLRGLNGESNINPCGGGPDTSGKYRWIGGAGHELGHAFNLPHPPGCGSGGAWAGCTGGQLAYYSLMYVGYAYYPGTYFLAQDKTDLLNTGFFFAKDLRQPRVSDFDNDRVSDLAVWRPSNGTWYISNSSTGNPSYVQWGASGDTIVPGDYDGDRKTDTAVWRASDTTWYIINSSNSTYTYVVYGSGSDIPVSADYDGDRITDIGVWRPSTATWYIKRSASSTEWILPFGSTGDRPVAADFNGDKRTDIAVFRKSNGNWYIYQHYLSYYYYTNPPANGNIIYTTTNYGLSDDNNTPADYDGDGKDDISVWRPSTGVWYYLASSNGTSYSHSIGQGGDIPAPGDYDNDGKTDYCVFRPSIGDWIGHPTVSRFFQKHWGQNGDIPVESAYVR